MGAVPRSTKAKIIIFLSWCIGAFAKIALFVEKMARPLALLLGGFVALSAVVVPTTGQYHAAYSFTEHAEAGDLQRNHVLKEVNQAGGVLETRKRHAPVLLQLALAAASLAVVLVILQCFRQLLGESKLRNAGFLHRRLAAGGEDPCEVR